MYGPRKNQADPKWNPDLFVDDQLESSASFLLYVLLRHHR